MLFFFLFDICFNLVLNMLKLYRGENMDSFDKTTLFDITGLQDALVETTLDEVADAIKEKGYSPVSQIVGYLVSGDLSYITTYKDARKKIESLERGKILEAIVRNYLDN